MFAAQNKPLENKYADTINQLLDDPAFIIQDEQTKEIIQKICSGEITSFDLDEFIDTHPMFVQNTELYNKFLYILKYLPIRNFNISWQQLENRLSNQQFALILAGIIFSTTIETLTLRDSDIPYIFGGTNTRLGLLFYSLECSSYLTKIDCNRRFDHDPQTKARIERVLARNIAFMSIVNLEEIDEHDFDNAFKIASVNFKNACNSLKEAIRTDLYDDPENNKKDISELLKLPSRKRDYLRKKYEADIMMLTNIWHDTIKTCLDNYLTTHPISIIEYILFSDPDLKPLLLQYPLITEENLNAILTLHQFKDDKLKKANDSHYEEAYRVSTQQFYEKSIPLLLANKTNEEKLTDLRQLAHQEFSHRHATRRLLKDALILVSSLFLGAGIIYGVYRQSQHKSFFFSNEKTGRAKNIERLIEGDLFKKKP